MRGPGALLSCGEALMLLSKTLIFLSKADRLSSQEFIPVLRFPRVVLCDGGIALAAVNCLDHRAKLGGGELPEHATFHGIHVDLGVAGQLNR